MYLLESKFPEVVTGTLITIIGAIKTVAHNYTCALPHLIGKKYKKRSDFLMQNNLFVLSNIKKDIMNIPIICELRVRVSIIHSTHELN